MRKTSKVIISIVAVAVVLAGMLVAIYAATNGSASVTATVSWTASQGVDLEFWANANGGTTASGATNSIAVQSISSSTTNAEATRGNIGSLSRSFSDTDDDGVNNPGPLTFNYYIKNKAIVPLNVKVTASPSAGVETVTINNNALVHTPRVDLSASVNDIDNASALSSVLSANGYDIPAGATLQYTVILSMAESGTNNGVNADVDIASFNANVAFNFAQSPTASAQTAPVLSISGVTATTSPVVGLSLGTYLDTVVTDKSTTCGWFFDSGLTQSVSDDYLGKAVSNATNLSLYTATASDLSNFTFTDIDANTCSVKASSTSISGDIVIPAYNSAGKKVVETYLDEDNEIMGFYGCTDITSVILPSTLTNINVGAFAGCTGLVDIMISDSVTSIGDYAFYSCSGLTSIIIPNGVTSIRDYAFCSCSGLTSITIPNSVTSIGNCAFSSSGLTSITIPNSVTSIGEAAFYNCYKLCEVVNDSELILTIGSGFDYGCVAAYARYIRTSSEPTRLLTFGDYTFYEYGTDAYLVSYNGNLTQLTLPSYTKNYGVSAGAFYDNHNITSVVIPDCVINIESSAFFSCDNLTSATIGNGITRIEDDTFYFSGLTSVTISNSVTSIGNHAFSQCSGLTSITIPNSVTSIGNYAFSSSGLTSITIPNSVTSIGNYIFSYCTSLASVAIPSSVTSIGEYAFRNCSGLTSMTIPNSVTSIGKYAFRNCSGLTSITIPNSVISMGDYVFKGCSGLTNATIGNSVTNIGQYAFEDCSSLTSVTIGSAVKSIGKYAFGYCNSLTSATFENTSGWKAGSTTLSSSDLANTSTAATYLKSTYLSSDWTRS